MGATFMGHPGHTYPAWWAAPTPRGPQSFAERLSCPPRAGREVMSRWPVCVHEAAHAVVGHACGMVVERISAWPGNAAVTMRDTTDDWRAGIMCRVAARVALDLADLGGLEGGDHWGTSTDLRQAHEIARVELGDDEKAAAAVRELTREVALVLADRAEDLSAVALGLAKRNALTGYEFRELLAA